MKKYLVLLCVIAFLSFSVMASAMTITPFDTADDMAQSLVGPGIIISNVTYTGAEVASGYFSDGIASEIGIDTGIVLTSGYASNLNGTSNTSDGITGANVLAGDTQLDALIPGYTTYDATILEFDFVSSGDAAYFNYVFGSDEYDEWVGSSYNDVFGFFINGTNVALIPGTTTPVAINNVNPGSYSEYYNDNDLSENLPYYFPFEYDGFTDVFTAEILGLTAGETYHIALKIADAGDYVLDSGVFIQAGSFSETPQGVPEPCAAILIFSLCVITGFISPKKEDTLS
jgi:hypothetical protein